jgi:cofilin
VEKTGARDETYEDFVKAITLDGGEDCRYGIFDMEYKHMTQGASASIKEKLILMSYCPDTARIRLKMIYASTFDAVKKPLVGISKIIQAADMGDIEYKCVLAKVRENDRR